MDASRVGLAYVDASAQDVGWLEEYWTALWCKCEGCYRRGPEKKRLVQSSCGNDYHLPPCLGCMLTSVLLGHSLLDPYSERLAFLLREEFLSLLRKYQKEALYVGCYYPDYATRLK